MIREDLLRPSAFLAVVSNALADLLKLDGDLLALGAEEHAAQLFDT
jgi:hypothetical protein